MEYKKIKSKTIYLQSTPKTIKLLLVYCCSCEMTLFLTYQRLIYIILQAFDKRYIQNSINKGQYSNANLKNTKDAGG